MKSLDDIAQALEGFDPQALSVDKAQSFIQHLRIRELHRIFTSARMIRNDVVKYR